MDDEEHPERISHFSLRNSQNVQLNFCVIDDPDRAPTPVQEAAVFGFVCALTRRARVAGTAFPYENAG